MCLSPLLILLHLVSCHKSHLQSLISLITGLSIRGNLGGACLSSAALIWTWPTFSFSNRLSLTLYPPASHLLSHYLCSIRICCAISCLSWTPLYLARLTSMTSRLSMFCYPELWNDPPPNLWLKTTTAHHFSYLCGLLLSQAVLLPRGWPGV